MRTTKNPRKLAKDNPVFMEHFEQELNPDIDIETLFTTAIRPMKYRVGNKIESIPVKVFCNRPDQCIDGSIFLKNHADVMRYIHKEDNEDIDFDTITIYSNKMVTLRLHDGFRRVRVLYLMNSSYKKYTRTAKKTLVKKGCGFLCDSELFREYFDPELNPGFKPCLYTEGSTEKIYYKDRYGKVEQVSILYAMMKWKQWQENKFYGSDWKEFWDEAVKLARYGIPSEDNPYDDEMFAKQCIDARAELICMEHRNSDMKVLFKCLGHDNHPPFEATIGRFFEGKARCPVCSGRRTIAGINDAATIDPEIEAFWSPENRRSCHEVSAAYKNVKLICPTCGYKFERCMKNFVGKHPKGPNRECPSRFQEKPKTDRNEEHRIANEFRMYLSMCSVGN